MAQLSPFVEHVLRRVGFGASEAEREQFSRYTYPIAVSVLTNFNPDETDVDDKIGTSGYVIVQSVGPAVLSEHDAGRRAQPLAVPDGALAGAAAGEDGAHLAPSLRHRAQQDLRHPQQHGQRDPADGRQAVRGSRPTTRPDRALPSVRPRQFPRAADRGGQRSRDALLARRPPQWKACPAGELRPRADGAVHDRCRESRRDGRVCRGPRVHRLEPVGESHAGLDVADLPVQLRRQQPRHRGERLQLPDLPRRRPTDSRARGVLRHAGRARSDQRARDPPRDGEADGPAALDLVRERNRNARPGVRGPHLQRLSRERHQHEARHPGGAVLEAVRRSGAASISGTAGRSSSSCARSRKWATSDST